ncbi:MAG: hypothetical protein J5I53_03710 [Bradyrhizobiaceae bacterium]|nr:hypothetical protein [Bradyrhizobiaceae bacterium]
MLVSSGSYVYCTGDAVNKIDPWGLAGQYGNSVQTAIPDWTSDPESHVLYETGGSYEEASPLGAGRVPWTRTTLFFRNGRGMWGSPHMAGFGPPSVMWGERGIGAPGGGDGIVPLHWKEDGLDASEPQNTRNGRTQMQPIASPSTSVNAADDPGAFMAVAGVSALSAAAVDGPLPFGDAVGLGILAAAVVFDATQRVYLTYTLRNATGQIYVGRTSGYGDPYTVMMARMRSHHMVRNGYGNPVLDVSAQGELGFSAIRGREQQLIDYYGGVGSPSVANRIRGVSPLNPLYPVYHAASNVLFGPLAPYSGF